jgi:hypothetical protein
MNARYPGCIIMMCMVWCGCEDQKVRPQAPSPQDMTVANVDEGVVAAVDMTVATDMPEPVDLSSPGAPDALAGLSYPVLDQEEHCESWLLTHASRVVKLPADYDALVPRISYPAMHRVKGLVHEGHNVVMRGEGKSSGLFGDSGAQIARRWRTLACGMGGLFVLRDSLFSQQDHALAHQPFVLMLPPNWVTRATWLTHEREPILNVAGFDEQDDAAWAAASDAVLFGSFPVSVSLSAGVRYPVGGPDVKRAARARHGRQALGQLHGHVQAMQRAAPFGWRAVSRAGAARIAWSDRAYFGAELRRDVIIPILVEHPNAHELEEGKGVLWEGGEQDVDREVIDAVTRDVYGARLRDGALALERYDNSQASDRQRAISLLEALIPEQQEDGPNTLLWLWINGPLDPHRKLHGESPLAYMVAFERELAQSSIDRSRLRLLGKPTTMIGRKLSPAATREALREALSRYREAGLDALSINQSATSLRHIAP